MAVGPAGHAGLGGAGRRAGRPGHHCLPLRHEAGPAMGDGPARRHRGGHREPVLAHAHPVSRPGRTVRGRAAVAGRPPAVQGQFGLYGSRGHWRRPPVGAPGPAALALVPDDGGLGRLHRARGRHGAPGFLVGFGHRPLHLVQRGAAAPAGGLRRGGRGGGRLRRPHRRRGLRGGDRAGHHDHGQLRSLADGRRQRAHHHAHAGQLPCSL